MGVLEVKNYHNTVIYYHISKETHSPFVLKYKCNLYNKKDTLLVKVNDMNEYDTIAGNMNSFIHSLRLGHWKEMISAICTGFS